MQLTAHEPHVRANREVHDILELLFQYTLLQWAVFMHIERAIQL